MYVSFKFRVKKVVGKIIHEKESSKGEFTFKKNIQNQNHEMLHKCTLPLLSVFGQINLSLILKYLLPVELVTKCVIPFPNYKRNSTHTHTDFPF